MSEGYDAPSRRLPSRVRETAPTYGEAPAPQRIAFRVTIADRGRIVLPAELREQLSIKDGDALTILVDDDGVVRMLTARAWTEQFVSTMRSAFGALEPGRRLADELIVERRREAAMEQRAARRPATGRSRKRRA